MQHAKQLSRTMIEFDQQKIQDWCRARNIDLMILFGSQATGKTHPRSDIDIALFSLQKGLRERHVRLYGEMEDLMGQEIDVAIIDEVTDPVLRLEVFQKGKCLYASHPNLFNDQKIQTIKIYDDTEPLRRMRDRVLVERIKALKNVTTHR